MSLGAFARDPGVAMAFQVQLQLPSGSYTDGSGSADAVLTRLMTNYKCLGLSSCHTQNFLHLKFGSIKKTCLGRESLVTLDMKCFGSLWLSMFIPKIS